MNDSGDYVRPLVCTRRTASSANSFVNRRCCVIEFLIAHGELSTFPKQVHLPSTGITRLQRYYEPLRHPRAPGLALTGVRLIIPDLAMGLPVLRALSLCTCCRHYPGAADGRTPRSYSPVRISLPRKGYRVGLHIDLFEDCSAFTHVAARTLARSPNRDPLTRGFRHFVTSMPAPVASGWSNL